jgi:hypothetical protein
MRLSVILLVSFMFMMGCDHKRRAMSFSTVRNQQMHVKDTRSNLDVKLLATEPGRVVVKLIDSNGTYRKYYSSSSSNTGQDNQVTEIVFDTQNKTTLINGSKHAYYTEGTFLLKGNTLIEQ